MPDSFWANITQTHHTPVWVPEDRYFKIVPKVSKPRSPDGSCIIKQSAPEDLRKNFELMYGRTNCGIRYLLGENWSEYGWKYCEELGLPPAAFMHNKDLTAEALEVANTADLPANHPRVGPWGHAPGVEKDEL